MVKNRNSDQKSIFWTKIQIIDKNPNLGKNRNTGKKYIKILGKNRNIGKNPNSG